MNKKDCDAAEAVLRALKMIRQAHDVSIEDAITGLERGDTLDIICGPSIEKQADRKRLQLAKMVSVACPKCGAKPGVPCGNSETLEWGHTDRHVDAMYVTFYEPTSERDAHVGAPLVSVALRE